jgi:hypothetical protein
MTEPTTATPSTVLADLAAADAKLQAMPDKELLREMQAVLAEGHAAIVKLSALARALSDPYSPVPHAVVSLANVRAGAAETVLNAIQALGAAEAGAGA